MRDVLGGVPNDVEVRCMYDGSEEDQTSEECGSVKVCIGRNYAKLEVCA